MVQKLGPFYFNFVRISFNWTTILLRPCCINVSEGSFERTVTYLVTEAHIGFEPKWVILQTPNLVLYNKILLKSETHEWNKHNLFKHVSINTGIRQCLVSAVLKFVPTLVTKQEEHLKITTELNQTNTIQLLVINPCPPSLWLTNMNNHQVPY